MGARTLAQTRSTEALRTGETVLALMHKTVPTPSMLHTTKTAYVPANERVRRCPGVGDCSQDPGHARVPAQG